MSSCFDQFKSYLGLHYSVYPSRTLWVQVHPYFHSSVHISITIQAIMLKFYDFVDKGTDCVLTKNDTVPSHNKQVIKQQQKNPIYSKAWLDLESNLEPLALHLDRQTPSR